MKNIKDRLYKPLLTAAGLICVALGAIGVILPLLPTTPFILLAAACFAKSSDRFHQWLLNNSVFGPVIINWRETRSIPKKSKYIAFASIVVSGAISVSLLSSIMLKLLVVTLLLFPVLLILNTPSTEDIANSELDLDEVK